MSKQENTKASGWDFRRLEENLGYAFQNPKLLKTALTHSSYANEARIKPAVPSPFVLLRSC